MHLGTTSPRLKRVLLIDAVVWASNYPAVSPFRNVYHWYARWIERVPQVALRRVEAEADDLMTEITGADALIISGSPRDAWNDDPVNVRLCEAIDTCRGRGMPVLGVCYGHQLLGRALGGVVGKHPQGLELGNTEVSLTPAGRQSLLFQELPEKFSVLSSHSDAVLGMPPECELLARGSFTQNQSFHWKNQFFGVQFHPETDPDTLRFLWSVRRDIWRPLVRFDLDQALDTLQPTPDAGKILVNFVTQIVP